MTVTYRGTRHGPGQVIVTVQRGGTVYPLPHRVHHSPDGFEWGYGGSGPSDLARSLLADYIGAVPDPNVYQRFKFEVVAALPADGWTLTDADIAQWLDGRHDRDATWAAR